MQHDTKKARTNFSAIQNAHSQHANVSYQQDRRYFVTKHVLEVTIKCNLIEKSFKNNEQIHIPIYINF